MDNEQAAKNFPRSGGEKTRDRKGSYNTERYYSNNRGLSEARRGKDIYADDEDQYDDHNSGKQENYKAGGYYGSNYGSINEWNRGRDYESNAGYRSSYDRLPTGQWPEVQEAADRRGFNLQEYNLAQRGIHRGKGPRGWQRSDQRIEEDINDVLTEDPYIDASEIEVTVDKGDVTLTGTVEIRHLKRRVEDLVEDVSGVRNVENRLRKRLPGGQSVDIHNTR